MIIHKNDLINTIIFSIQSFKNTVKNNLTKEKNIIDTLNYIFSRNTILIEKDFEVLNYLKENETLPEYLTEVSKSIKFNSSSN